MITCTFEDGNAAKLRHVVVDGLVLNKKGEILLVKRTGKLLEGGKWGLVGGHTDRDETLAQALERKEDIAFDHGEDIELYQKYLREQLPLPLSAS